METSARRRLVDEALVVAGGSLAASVAFTWPLVLHLQSRARDLIDTLFQAWTIDWVQHAVTSGVNPYDANIYSPEKTTLAFSDTLFGVAIPTLPLRWLGMTPIGVLNTTLILGFAASAAAAYLFARLVTGSRLAATVTGAAYAFGPFGALATRHVHVAVRPGVPLAAAAAWWLAERARAASPGAGWRPLLAPAISLLAVVAWQGTVSFYPATYAVVTAVVVLVVRWRSLGRSGLVAAAGALAASAAVLALLAIPNLEVSARDPSYHFSLESFGPLGANFTHTEPGVVVWGPVLGLGDTDTMRNAVFPGLVLLGLASVGTVAGWRARGRFRSITVLGVALVAVGAVLAVGTAATGWRRYAPYRLLYEIGPPFDALRATARAWMIGLLGLGLVAGLGARAVAQWACARAGARAHTERASRSRVPRPSSERPIKAVPVIVGVVVVVLVLLEGFDPWFDRPTARVPPVDTALTRLEPGGVVYLPMNVSDQVDIGYFAQPRNLYGATAHHRRTPNGYAGYLPASYLDNSRRLRSLPDDRSLALLRRLRVRYVVVHPNVDSTPWAALRSPGAAAPLHLVGRYGRDLLYEVPNGG
ncbi:MAG TPA: hypothetical protein VIH82_03695 [Acidimicrobiia bacterium]|jgi:hypothetical protein